MTMIAPDAVSRRMLKIRTGDLLAAVGGLEAAAGFCWVGKSTLARYASLSPVDADCFAPIDVVRDLERVAGQPLVTAHLCAMADGAFVALPGAQASGTDLLALLGKQAKESGEVAQGLCRALADGRIDPAEAAGVRAEVRQLIEIAVAMDAELAAIEGERA